MYRSRVCICNTCKLIAVIHKKSIMKIGFFPTTTYYLVAVLLSNITNCLQGNQTSKWFNTAPPTLNEYLHMDQDLDKEESNNNKVF